MLKTKQCYTFEKLVEASKEKGANLADVAIGRMMTIIEEETGRSPSWDDVAPEWVVRQTLG